MDANQGAPMSRMSFKAVAIGGVADIVTTNILAIPLMAYVVVRVDAIHLPKDQLQAALMGAINASPALLATQIVVGLAASAFGGCLAGRIAKHDEALNGALSAWLCIAIGVYAIVAGSTTGSILLQLADFVAAPLAGFGGGYLASRRKRASAPRI
jgi:hypothetical protein